MASSATRGAASSAAPDPATHRGVSRRIVAGLEILEVTAPGDGRTAPASPLPALLVLHGLGDRPESFLPLVARLPVATRVVLARGPTPRGGGASWFPYPAPAEEIAAGVRGAAGRLEVLLATLSAEPAYPRPFVVTGFSQGGVLSFALAALHPTRIRAALPVAGFLPESLEVATGPGPPPLVRAFHGDADTIVPIDRDRRTTATLKAHGYDVALTEFTGVPHLMPPDLQEQLLEAAGAALSAP